MAKDQVAVPDVLPPDFAGFDDVPDTLPADFVFDDPTALRPAGSTPGFTLEPTDGLQSGREAPGSLCSSRSGSWPRGRSIRTSSYQSP